MLTYRREMSEVYESLDAGAGEKCESKKKELSQKYHARNTSWYSRVGDTFETALFWHVEK